MESPLDWEIVAEYVYANDINDYYLFTQLQGDKPFCVLQKVIFLRYAKPEYHPNTVHVKAMREYLQTITDSQNVEMLLRDLQDMIELDMGIEDILDVLGQEGLCFESKKDLNAFLSLYRDLNQHTRKCVNRGYTPAELDQLMPITGQMSLFGND